MESKKLLVFV